MSKSDITPKKTFLKEIGIRVKKLRESKGLSQFQLAVEADIPKNQVGRIERGEINTTIFTLKKITDSLGVTINEIIV